MFPFIYSFLSISFVVSLLEYLMMKRIFKYTRNRFFSNYCLPPYPINFLIERTEKKIKRPTDIYRGSKISITRNSLATNDIHFYVVLHITINMHFYCVPTHQDMECMQS
jgi:hypothetical protein